MLRFSTKICFVMVVTSILLFITTPLYANYNSVLKQGMRGQEVYQLQVKLQEYGYYHDEIDGVFGSNTKSAVIRFQLDLGLHPDGIVGQTTWENVKEYRNINPNRGYYSRSRGYNIATLALKHLGVGYSWGGTSPYGFDCSGFVYYIFAQNGIALPRMADEQFNVGTRIRLNELEYGDMVFFSTYEPGPSHVGIYIGDNQFVHASSAAGRVVITSLSQPYYSERYLGARRIVY